jgi:hypothetical protein
MAFWIGLVVLLLPADEKQQWADRNMRPPPHGPATPLPSPEPGRVPPRAAP